MCGTYGIWRLPKRNYNCFIKYFFFIFFLFRSSLNRCDSIHDVFVVEVIFFSIFGKRLETINNTEHRNQHMEISLNRFYINNFLYSMFIVLIYLYLRFFSFLFRS